MRVSRWIGPVAAAALAVTGCKEKPKPAADAAPEAPPAPERKPIDAKLLGASAGPFGGFAGLEVGMSLADARAKRASLYDASGPVPLKDPGYQVSYYVVHDGDAGPIKQLMATIEGDAGAARAAITAAWGEPFAVTSFSDYPRYYWFNPSGGWRARIDDKTLWLERYAPLGGLLDRARSMLGKPVAELGPDYDKAPPTEFGGGSSAKLRVESSGDPPVVDTVRLTIFFDVFDARGAIAAPEIREYQWKLFLNRYDSLETRRQGGEDVHTFRKADPRIVITERRGASNRFEIVMSR